MCIRHLMKEGGIYGGSAVGLVKKLQLLSGHERDVSSSQTSMSSTPAVIILNPGMFFRGFSYLFML